MRRFVLVLAALAAGAFMAGGAALAATRGGATGDSGTNVGTDSSASAGAYDAALDASLKELVAMRGGPPGAIAIVQRGSHREIHAFGVRNIRRDLPMPANDRMRIASTSKALGPSTIHRNAWKGNS